MVRHLAFCPWAPLEHAATADHGWVAVLQSRGAASGSTLADGGSRAQRRSPRQAGTLREPLFRLPRTYGTHWEVGTASTVATRDERFRTFDGRAETAGWHASALRARYRTGYHSYPGPVRRTPGPAEASGQDLRVLIDQRRDAIKAAVARHRGRRVRIFGSVARGEERAGSDIDFLVEFGSGSSLFDLMHLNRELEDLLDHRVDVVSEGGLKERDYEILDEAAEL